VAEEEGGVYRSSKNRKINKEEYLMANEFGLREQREVADAMGLFERLLNLDGTWTDYLQNAESIPDSDVEVLRELADDMDQLLVECEPQARRVSEIFDEHPQLVEETFEDLMSSPEITDETRRSWDRLVERHEGIVPLEVRAISHVSRTVPATRRELSEKMSHIEAGEFIPGDLPPCSGVVS
jgi:hypothetical protein